MPRSIVRIGRLITARAYSSLFYSIALGLSVSIGPLKNARYRTDSAGVIRDTRPGT